jgi:hypothetical protein
MIFPWIDTKFLSWQHYLHKGVLRYYFSESKALQKTPWTFKSSNTRSLGWGPKQSKAGAAVFRRRWSPAARSKGRGILRSLRWSCCATCRRLGWPEWWSSTGTRDGGGGVNGDGEAPAVGWSCGCWHTVSGTCMWWATYVVLGVVSWYAASSLA